MDVMSRIKEIRKTKGITLRELSSLCGYSTSYLSDVECGVIKNPSKDRLITIANSLEVDIDEILTYNSSSPNCLEKNNVIGEKLRSLRKEYNMTQKNFLIL